MSRSAAKCPGHPGILTINEIKMKKNTKAILNYSGIEITGTLINFNSDRFIYQFKIICPFTKVERIQNFIKSDIIKIIN